MDKEDVIFKYSLLNASQHNGKANVGAVIGSIMSNEEDLRKNAKEISGIVPKVVAKVNGMSVDEQKEAMDKIGVTVEKKSTKKSKGLEELKGDTKNVKLRFAPNPSGPLHLGHARAAVLNQEYVKRYDGDLILRIEDTDPKRVYEPAYDMILDDLKWLGIQPDETYVQSERIDIYYDYAKQAIELGVAYMCSCEAGEFKKLKDNCTPCPCRDLSVEENLEKWDKFKEMNEGEAVLRIKTDINHKNPAIRDWPAMRIVDAEHPLTKNKYRIYPMMNFSVVIDDHLMGITHVLRGKDHLANSEKQKYLYDHFGWEVPEFIHYGRLKMEDIALSTSKAMEGINDGKYSGWDDPRLGTFRAIAKRGIKSEAIVKLMLEFGVKISDSVLSWKKIYGLNRNILEESSNRYFFVKNSKKLSIDDVENEIIKRPLHPNFLERGEREIPFDGDVLLDQDDLKEGKILRLMDAVNVSVEDGQLKFHSKSFEEARKVKANIVHWVPANNNLKANIIMPDTDLVEGYVEPFAEKIAIGDVVQFERFGFARLDSKNSEVLNFYYAHK